MLLKKKKELGNNCWEDVEKLEAYASPVRAENSEAAVEIEW